MASSSNEASPTAAILLADGTEEIEFVTVFDVLTRASIPITSHGVPPRAQPTSTATAKKGEKEAVEKEEEVNPPKRCSRNTLITPSSASLPSPPPSCLIIPGGAPGAAAMRSSVAVRELINAVVAAGGTVAALCAGTTVLVDAGDDAGWKCPVVGHPSVRAEVEGEKGWDWVDGRRVCVSERVGTSQQERGGGRAEGGRARVVTSIGPGSAMLFALTLVELLAGKEKRKEVEGPMCLAAAL